MDQLSLWFDLFPREQMLVLKSEQLFTEPAEIMARVFEFLGLREWKSLHYRRKNSLSYSQMSSTTRHRLAEYFEPHNQRLYQLLGVDFGWERDVL